MGPAQRLTAATTAASRDRLSQRRRLLLIIATWDYATPESGVAASILSGIARRLPEMSPNCHQLPTIVISHAP